MVNARFSIIVTGLMCVGVALAVKPNGEGKKGQSSLEQRIPGNGEVKFECLATKSGYGYSDTDVSYLTDIAKSASRKGVLGQGEVYVELRKNENGKVYFSQAYLRHGRERIDFEGFQVPKPDAGQLIKAGAIGFGLGAAVVGYAAYRKFGGGIFRP